MTARACGGCQLCCRLVPVEEIGKHAGEKCRYAGFRKGCEIHHRPSMFPESCRLWSCGWLVDPDAAGLRRPDRTRYVVDMALDVIRETQEDGPVLHDVMQVWCDPAVPRAWRDPDLLAYIQRKRLPALIRYDQVRALLVVPPCLSADGAWIEKICETADDIPGSIHNSMKAAGMALPVKTP
jgi:hypothetical protein